MLPALHENFFITFVSKTKKAESDGMVLEKTEYIKFEFFVDPENPASCYSKEFLIFKDEFPEEWIKWLMGHCNIEVMMPLREPGERAKMIRTLLKGQALAQFDYHLGRRLNSEDSETPDHELLEIVTRDLGLDYISRRAIRVQRYYMRRCLFMGPSTRLSNLWKDLMISISIYSTFQRNILCD